MNLFKELPFDVIQRVLYYLPLQEIISFLRTCTDYSIYFESNAKIDGKNTFWENVFFAAFGYRILGENCQNELKRKVIEESSWKSKQYDVLKAEDTWDINNIDLRFYRTSCVHWNKEIVIWGDNKGEITLRFANNNNIIRGFKFHGGLVWGLKKIGNVLYSVSDCSPYIGVFEMEELEQENFNLKPLYMISHQTIGEEDNVVCMWVLAVSENGLVYSGDNRGYVYLFDAKGNFLKKFPTNSGGIFSMNCLGEESVLVGCTSGLIARYNREGEILNSVQLTEKDYARSISVIGDNIVVGTTNCKIQLRTSTLDLIWEYSIMEPKTYTLNELVVFENYIISTGVGVFEQNDVSKSEKEKQKEKKKEKDTIDYGVWVQIMDHRLNIILDEQIKNSKLKPVSRVYHISKVKGSLCLAAGNSSYTIEINNQEKKKENKIEKYTKNSNYGDKKLNESCLIS